MKVTKEKMGLALMGTALVTNPLSGQYVLDGLDWLFSIMFRHGAFVSLIAGIYVAWLLMYQMYTTSRVNVPKKGQSAKNKPIGKFLEV